MSKSGFNPGDIPSKPGVYVFRDRFGKVIYVGKAANLRRRVSQYFQPSRNTKSDPKLRSLINSINSWEYFVVRNEDESLILESRLIKQYAPKYNVLLRDDKRFWLIKIDLNAPFPRLQLARVRKDDGCRYYGPFPKAGALRPTIDFLSRYFGMRVCKPLRPGEKDHTHCLASIIKDCSEPCIGRVDEQEYRKCVEEMLSVLEGNTKELLDDLRGRMKKDATSKRFEQAAKWRDLIENIELSFGQQKRSFRYAAIPAFTNEESVIDLKDALGMEEIPNVIECFDISNIGGQMAVASMVCFEGGQPARRNYRRFRIRDVMQSDDFAMMKEAVSRHYGRKLRENRSMPDLIMIDGGKGQLSAAISGLREVGCNPLPIIGLAKKNEEIFVPGYQDSLVLDRHRPALRLLQAVRDEAHRFAVNYHRSLRSKRLQESILDDIPGVGSAKKRELLKAFGSVRDIRKATVDELTERVPGIGRKLATEIVASISKNKKNSE